MKTVKTIKQLIKYKDKEDCVFEGDIDFKGSGIVSLGRLKKVNGYAYFSYSKIKDLGELKKIGGYAFFNEKHKQMFPISILQLKANGCNVVFE